MSKKKKNYQGAKKASAPPASPAPTSAETEESGSTRRHFLRNLLFGGAAVAATTAGVAYLASGDGEENKEFVTTAEAVAIYRSLKDTVKHKLEEAKTAGKPLKIVVLEDHTGEVSFAYKAMLVDICKQLGIDNILTENNQSTIDFLAHNEANPDNILAVRAQHLINKAQKNSQRLQGIDNAYPSIEAEDAECDKLTSEYARRAINVLDPHATNVQVTVKSDASFIGGMNWGVEGDLIIPREAMDKLILDARHHAQKDTAAKRMQTMNSAIEHSGNALVVIGKGHGRELVTSLRNHGQLDVAFTTADKNLHDEHVPAEDMQWAETPQNAIQYEGKKFNPTNLTTFLDNAIKRAASRETSR